ncbi:hypothetical protein A2U01_0088003, partial [Trifolium medium]|nr:hypothetical protein [Trifolium medium]
TLSGALVGISYQHARSSTAVVYNVWCIVRCVMMETKTACTCCFYAQEVFSAGSERGYGLISVRVW